MPLTVEERQNVHDAMVRYTFAADVAPDEVVLRSILTEDVEFVTPMGVFRGDAALARLLDDTSHATLQARHLLTNVLIDGDGDRAQLSAYFLRIRNESSVDGDRMVDQTVGSYLCLFRRVDGVWKMARRETTFAVFPSVRRLDAAASEASKLRSSR